jgi:uncharacterized protein
MDPTDVLGRLLAGGVGGIASGFLGITSGGILVPLLVLLLGKDQHVAQGVSLVVQVVPTSLSGVRNYSRSGHRVPMRWLVFLAFGFGIGGCVGALLATHVTNRALQWTFVGYLVILEAIILLRPHAPRWKAPQTNLKTGRCIGACSSRSAPLQDGRRDFSVSAADLRSPR